jgi:hypothetical protein
MLRSDVEYFMNNWDKNVSKIFRWRRAFLPDEYLAFFIDEKNMYKVNDSVSTSTMDSLNRDDMIKMLINEELYFMRNHDFYCNLTDMKTGGCTCGAWAVRGQENLHDDKCSARFKNATEVKK